MVSVVRERQDMGGWEGLCRIKRDVMEEDGIFYHSINHRG